MSTTTFVELSSVLDHVIKEEPLNHDVKEESTANTDANWEMKLEMEDYNPDDLHHAVDIKDEMLFEPRVTERDPEITSLHNHQTRPTTKRKLSCSVSREDVISVVSKKPALWNPTHSDHKSENIFSIWQDVAQELGVTGEGLSCKAKWNSIKEQYINWKQSDENRKHLNKWKFADKLSFLDPYFDKSTRESNLTTPSSFCNPLEVDSSKGTNSTTPSLSSVAEKKRNRKFSNDSVTSFFISIENTVRKLPPDLQIEAKRNIFEVITNCELMAMKRNSNQQSS